MLHSPQIFRLSHWVNLLETKVSCSIEMRDAKEQQTDHMVMQKTFSLKSLLKQFYIFLFKLQLAHFRRKFEKLLRLTRRNKKLTQHQITLSYEFFKNFPRTISKFCCHLLLNSDIKSIENITHISFKLFFYF